MTDEQTDPSEEATPPESGALTAPEGTPVAVDITRDLRARDTWVVLLAGPVIWFAHFMVVYMVAEAGCTGSGPGLHLLDPPVPATVTVVATIIAVVACLGFAGWSFRRSRTGIPDGEADDEVAARGRHRELAFVGMLLSLLSALAVLFVGAPALVFTGC